MGQPSTFVSGGGYVTITLPSRRKLPVKLHLFSRNFTSFSRSRFSLSAFSFILTSRLVSQSVLTLLPFWISLTDLPPIISVFFLFCKQLKHCLFPTFILCKFIFKLYSLLWPTFFYFCINLLYFLTIFSLFSACYIHSSHVRSFRYFLRLFFILFFLSRVICPVL